jgi:hypothetical protein
MTEMSDVRARLVPMETNEPPGFNGPYYEPAQDDERLTKQHDRIKRVMLDGAWRSLAEIEKLTGDPPASISAQLRHLRKKRFGSWNVEVRSRGIREDGLYEYRLLPPSEQDGAADAVDEDDHPRLLKHHWRELAQELPLVIAMVERQGHVTSDSMKKLAAYAAWCARPRSYPRRDSNPQSPS